MLINIIIVILSVVILFLVWDITNNWVDVLIIGIFMLILFWGGTTLIEFETYYSTESEVDTISEIELK